MILGRVIAPGEPAWLEEDLNWAKALLMVEAQECPGCGHPRADTQAKEADGQWVAEILRCHACAAAERLTRSLSRDKAADMAGLQIRTRRR